MGGSADDTMQKIGTYFSGSASSSDIDSNMKYLKDPNQANYQIQGLGDYQNAQAGLANQAQQMYQDNTNNPLVSQGQGQQLDAYNSLANMAAGNGPSLARANMQAGLNQTNSALQSQAMSSAGGAGAGNSQRNLLNAQAAASGNALNQANQASVAEQMGALQQQGGAANALRSAAQGQQQINLGNQQALMGNQQNAYNSMLNANAMQAQNNMNYDQNLQNEGLAKSNIGIQGTNSGAAAKGGFVKTGTSVLSSLAKLSAV